MAMITQMYAGVDGVGAGVVGTVNVMGGREGVTVVVTVAVEVVAGAVVVTVDAVAVVVGAAAAVVKALCTQSPVTPVVPLTARTLQ